MARGELGVAAWEEIKGRATMGRYCCVVEQRRGGPGWSCTAAAARTHGGHGHVRWRNTWREGERGPDWGGRALGCRRRGVPRRAPRGGSGGRELHGGRPCGTAARRPSGRGRSEGRSDRQSDRPLPREAGQTALGFRSDRRQGLSQRKEKEKNLGRKKRGLGRKREGREKGGRGFRGKGPRSSDSRQKNSGRNSSN